jgi:molybdate transport system substrate-binding protein
MTPPSVRLPTGTPTFISGLLLLVLAALFAVAPATSAQAVPTLQVAAAADLRFVLSEIAATFEQDHRARVLLTFGSSGQLAAQIEQGAPFDLFFSADEAFVRQLVERAAVDRSSVTPYAIGRIVVWVRNDSTLDVRTGLRALLNPAVRFIAIANPQHAPYGAAAVEALRRAGILGQVARKLVYGENISETLQFVQTGNADAGIVALSLAVAPTVAPTGRFILIPATAHAPILQAAGVTTRAAQPTLARAFLQAVTAREGQALLRRYGFAIPRAAP